MDMDMEDTGQHRQSTKRRRKKRQELRIKVLKKNLMKRFEAEEDACYSNNNNRIANSTPAPKWARDADKGLRTLILSERAYYNYRASVKSSDKSHKQRSHKEYHCANKEETSVTVNSRGDISGGAVSAKEFKNAHDAEHNGITSEDMRQSRTKRFKSEPSFKVVSGDKCTLKRNGRADSYNKIDTLTGPVRVEHTENKIILQPKKLPSVYCPIEEVEICLPQKFDCKNIEAKNNFQNASDGNKFWVPASNPNEKDRLQKTEEMKPDSKFAPRKRLLKRKTTDPAGRPAPERRTSIEFTFNSVEEYEFTVTAPGRNTNITPSGLSKTKGTYCLSTKRANYVLNKKNNNIAFNTLLVSQAQQASVIFIMKYFQEIVTNFWSRIRRRHFVVNE